MTDPMVICYLFFLASLASFALHRCWLAYQGRKTCASVPILGARPPVLVQLPIYNEGAVTKRLLAAVAALDYPKDKLHIQLLDDSDDDSVDDNQREVSHYEALGFSIHHIRRGSREGFKAGALAYGLKMCNAPFVAIFDADFLPPPDFLQRTLAHLLDDDGLGLVQARWGHLNRSRNILTTAQATLLDGHFCNEHSGRAAQGHFFNFNGTAGVWRRRAIEEGGGWSGRTITEDLDLSYRAQLAGWRFRYLQNLVVPAELPEGVLAFKTQQHRWAKGSVETALYLLPKIFSSSIPLATKGEAVFHLTANIAYPMVIALGALMPWAIAQRYGEALPIAYLVADSFLFVAATLSVWAFYAVAIRRAGGPSRRLWTLPAAMALGSGLAINNTRAVLEALVGHRSAFVRTPKTGGGGNKPEGREPLRRYALRLAEGFLEVAFGAYIASALFHAVGAGQYLAIPFILMFASGFLYLGGATVVAICRQFRASSFALSLTGRLRPRRI